MKPIKQLFAIALPLFAVMLAAPQICSADMVSPGILGTVNSNFSAILAFIAVYLGIITIGEYFIKKFFKLPDEKSLLFSFMFSLSIILFGCLFYFLTAFMFYFLGPGGDLLLFLLIVSIIIPAAGGIPFYLLSKKFWKSFFTSAGIIFSSLAFLFVVGGIPLLSEILTISFAALFFWKLTGVLIKNIAPKIKTVIKIIAAIIIIGLSILFFLYMLTASYSGREGANYSAKNARIQSYFDQMRTAAAVWQTSQTTSTYIGFNTSGDGLILENKIKEISGGDNYNTVISKNNFCAKAKFVGGENNDYLNAYWCIDSYNGYSGKATSTDACTESNPDCL